MDNKVVTMISFEDNAQALAFLELLRDRGADLAAPHVATDDSCKTHSLYALHDATLHGAKSCIEFLFSVVGLRRVSLEGGVPGVDIAQLFQRHVDDSGIALAVLGQYYRRPCPLSVADICPRGDDDGSIPQTVRGGAVDELRATQSQPIQFHRDGALLARDVAMGTTARPNLAMAVMPAADAVGDGRHPHVCVRAPRGPIAHYGVKDAVDP